MFSKENKINQYYSETEVVNSTRTLSILSSLLFLMFAFVDIWAIPSTLFEVLVARGVVITCLLTTYFFTFNTHFYKYKDIVLSAIFLVSSFGIEYMIYKAQPSDHASSVYFVGLVLILMTLYSWTYLNFIASIAITGTVVTGYFIIEMFFRLEGAILSIPELITNLFFIASAVVIGIVARLMRDKFIRENFILQQSLEKALEDKTEEAEDNAYLANHDALTGLANRRYATEKLEISLEIAKQKGKVLVILFIDLNGFKQINDIYGHAVGDDVLRITARRLELAVRKSDCLSRLGGDEYLIGLLIDKESLHEVESMVEKYSTIITDPIKTEGVRLQVGASIGLAAYPMHGNNITVLMDIADKKMYQVKQGKQKANNVQDDDSSPVVIFPGNRKTR